MVNWNFEGNIDEILLTDDNVSEALKKCILDGFLDTEPEFSGGLGTRIGAIFVILITSTLVSVLPLLTKQYKFKIPLYFYLFARYFGAGVIIATAFIHLMDPAYGAIGPDSCVGGWGNWNKYTWPPALMLLSVFIIFITELVSEVLVERKYGHASHVEPNVEKLITGAASNTGSSDNTPHLETGLHGHTRPHIHVNTLPQNTPDSSESLGYLDKNFKNIDDGSVSDNSVDDLEIRTNFSKQISAFLMLEFGVLFHSIVIGLNLGSASYTEFKTLYIVLIFHQSFEGLGIGARLSAIEFPKDVSIMYAYLMCIVYGMVTPVAIAIGIGVRTSYASSSFTSTVISGTLDSLSAGVLLYTGFVEFLGRDFIFNEEAKRDLPKLLFNLFSMMLGCLLMALLGKWA